MLQDLYVMPSAKDPLRKSNLLQEHVTITWNELIFKQIGLALSFWGQEAMQVQCFDSTFS